MAFPAWVIGIIILVVIVATSTTVYLVFRKKIRKNKAAVGAQDEEMVLEKNVATPSSSSYPTIPLYSETDSTLHHDEKAVFTEHLKINLPLPPPSASLFSDKMELDSTEANDLYLAYMAASQTTETIDDKPFLSNAAANIQQKAATLRSTLRQSMRRKSTHKNSVVPINQLFDISTSNSSPTSVKSKSPISMSRQSSSTFPHVSLQTLPPSPVPDSPSTLESFAGRYSNNSSKKSLIRHNNNDDAASTKIMVPDESNFSLPMSPISPSVGKPAKQQQQDYSNVVEEINQYTHDLNVGEESEEEQDQTRQDSEEEIHSPQEAAAKLIRTASRKSRTRSLKMNEAQDTYRSNQHVSTYATVRGRNKNQLEAQQLRNNAPTYATVRGKPPLQRINTSNTNARPGLEPFDSPSPQRTLMSSNVSGSATVSGKKRALQKSFHQNNNNNETAATNGRTSLKDLFSNLSPESNSTNNVDTIRRMLQSSWSGNNIKESASTNSLSSSEPMMISPVGSINPRLQNQHLVSLSLKASNSTNRPSMPSAFMELEGPAPTVSFSSSTVRTMIPAEEEQHQQQQKPTKKKLRPSRLGNKTPAQKEREKYLKSIH